MKKIFTDFHEAVFSNSVVLMQLVVFYKSVLGILRRETNPYLKLIEARNFLVSKRKGIFSFPGSEAYFNIYGALWCSIHEEIRHSSYVWQIFKTY